MFFITIFYSNTIYCYYFYHYFFFIFIINFARRGNSTSKQTWKFGEKVSSRAEQTKSGELRRKSSYATMPTTLPHSWRIYIYLYIILKDFATTFCLSVGNKFEINCMFFFSISIFKVFFISIFCSISILWGVYYWYFILD